LSFIFKGFSGSLKDVVVLVGSGSIGQAIARRVGSGKHIVLADINLDNAQIAAKTFGVYKF
jgi:threonine dehydrogenase-like Zn-dependent dehydrogenase